MTDRVAFYLKRLRETGLREAALRVQSFSLELPEDVQVAAGELDKRSARAWELANRQPENLTDEDRKILEDWHEWNDWHAPVLLEYGNQFIALIDHLETTVKAALLIVEEADREGVFLPDLKLTGYVRIIERFRERNGLTRPGEEIR